MLRSRLRGSTPHYDISAEEEKENCNVHMVVQHALHPMNRVAGSDSMVFDYSLLPGEVHTGCKQMSEGRASQRNISTDLVINLKSLVRSRLKNHPGTLGAA